MMIHRIFAMAGCLGVASSLSAQSRPRSATDSISQWVTGIDAGRSRMRRTVLDLPGASTEGGQLVLYGVGGSLQKLVAIYAGETGMAVECYYSRNDTLRFFTRKEVHYDRPLSGHVVRSTVEQLWFVGDSAIQWRDTLGRLTRNGAPLGSRGEDVRREFRNTFQLSHQGYASQTRMSNELCS